MSTPIAFAENRYDAMPYRRCGRSGLVLPPIALGFWQSVAAAGADDLCREAMTYAFDRGVTHFDLANNYGPPPGHAEELFGRVVKAFPRDELVIATKAGWRMWPGPYGDGGSRKYLLASLDQSLKRMGLEYVDIFYHHRWTPETPLEESMGALKSAVDSGKALYVGVSSYTGAQFAEAVQVMRDLGGPPLIINQVRYHMLHRGIEWDLMPQTERAGAGIAAFCPLDQGFLTNKYERGIPEQSRVAMQPHMRKRYEDREADGTMDRVRQLIALARERGQTMAQLALAWTLRNPAVTTALVGVSKMEQLKDNLGALEKLALSEDEVRRIDAILGNGSPRPA